jgi:hypothetical protein
MISLQRIANEALMHLENELVLGSKVHTDYSDDFAMEGDTIQIRRPVRYLGQDNNLDVTSYNEDVQQGKTTITMDQTVSIPVTITALERTLAFDRFSEDILKPAAIRMRDRIETAIASKYTQFYHFAGTPATTPGTFLSLAECMGIMTDAAMPTSGRVAVHPTVTGITLADGLKAVYVSSVAKTAIEEASIGRYAGFDNYMSVHAPVHVPGTGTGTPLVNGASQSVTYATAKDTWTQTLVTKGWTNSITGILKAGDVFTIGGVYAVNPISKQSTGRLQTFVVTADADSGASTGPCSPVISPPIIISGAYQTVSAAPAADAPIVLKTGTGGTSRPQSLLFAPKAIALVTRPIDIPQGSGVKTARQSGNQVSISVTEYVAGDTLKQRLRLDMLFGVKVINPDLGMRLTA